MSDSSYEVMEGQYCYVKAATPPTSGHFLVAQDRDEITVVTREELVPDVDAIEVHPDRFCLIALHVAVPFYSVGFLARVCGAVAEAGLDILIVSTFSKDYILVRFEDRDRTVEAIEGVEMQAK